MIAATYAMAIAVLVVAIIITGMIYRHLWERGWRLEARAYLHRWQRVGVVLHYDHFPLDDDFPWDESPRSVATLELSLHWTLRLSLELIQPKP